MPSTGPKVVNTSLPIEYLSIWFASHLTEFKHIGSGTTVPGIKLSDLESALVPLPPIAEQHRIADKVNELLGLIIPVDSHVNCIPLLITCASAQVDSSGLMLSCPMRSASSAMSGLRAMKFLANRCRNEVWIHHARVNSVTFCCQLESKRYTACGRSGCPSAQGRAVLAPVQAVCTILPPLVTRQALESRYA